MKDTFVFSAFGFSRSQAFIEAAKEISPDKRKTIKIEESDLAAADFHDLSKLLGYIPVIGTIVGIARLLFSALIAFFGLMSLFDPTASTDDKKGFFSFAATHLVRSVIEMSGISLVVLPIVDLLVDASEMNHTFEDWTAKNLVHIATK